MNHLAGDLGEIRRTFRPKMANVIAGAIIGLTLLIGGISLALVLAQQDETKPLDMGDRIAKYVLLAVLGIGAPTGGIALLLRMKRLASHRVTVHADGFTFAYAGSTDTCPWSELEKIEEVFTEEQLKVLKVPGAVLKNLDRSFVLYRKDGKEFHFTVNSIDSIPRFAACLEAARDQFGIRWERVEQ